MNLQEVLIVDDVVCTFADYSRIENRTDRLALQEKIFNRLRTKNSDWHEAVSKITKTASDKKEAKRLVAELPKFTSTFMFPYQFAEVFARWESAVETTIDELNRRLLNHDWYYNMSDDHRVYSSGKRNYDRIVTLVKLLGEEGQRVYESHKPVDL